ncbi:DUF2721 domain-containing protein [Bacteroidota bacterium]
MESTQDFIQFLQSGITPVALISGVGLILLTLNNRLGRTVDHSRKLLERLDTVEGSKREITLKELRIMYKRSKILRSSIGSISLSILTSSLIIAVLLIGSITNLNLAAVGKLLFSLSILGIIASAIFLVADISLTLKALNYEVRHYLEEEQ